MRLLLAAALFASVSVYGIDDYQLGPLSQERPAVPHGTVTQMPAWESKIFSGTTREWSVYVPAQFKPAGSAAVMVFQDGHDYAGVKGAWRVPVVLDNLIATGDVPPMVAVFVDPGHELSKEKPKSAWQNSNRSVEYDSLGDRYARFLIEEILAEVEKKWPLSHDPEMRAICGASSGGICSFTVAWERPDQFRKVLSTIGTFTNIRGGNAYPSLIRKTERKPIRVFQQDGENDLDNAFVNWPLANKQMHAALKYVSYDCHFELGDGQHNSKHGASIFPDAMKWLWRKESPKPEINLKGDLAGDMTLHRLLIPGEEWQVVAEGLGFADGPCSDSEGNFYFSDMKAPGIFEIALDGTKTKLADEPASGLAFGPDGILYACQASKKRVVAISLDGKPPLDLGYSDVITVVAKDVQANDLVVTSNRALYFTETGKHQITQVWLQEFNTRAVDTGITAPNGIALSPDEGTVAVSDYGGENVWTFRYEADLSFGAKAPYMTMRLPIDPKGKFERAQPPPYKQASGGDGMTTDKDGRYYVTSALGVQVFDPTGRLCGVIAKPQPDKPLTSCCLAGPGQSYLYVTNGDKIFRRKVQAQGNALHSPAR